MMKSFIDWLHWKGEKVYTRIEFTLVKIMDTIRSNSWIYDGS
jgi:hypothetical protein